MTLNGVMAVISANSGSFRAYCVKVHVRYLISWRVLVNKQIFHVHALNTYILEKTGDQSLCYHVMCVYECFVLLFYFSCSANVADYKIMT